MTTSPHITYDTLAESHRFTRELHITDAPPMTSATVRPGKGTRQFSPQHIRVWWDSGDARDTYLVSVRGPQLRADGTTGYTTCEAVHLLVDCPAWLQELLGDGATLAAMPVTRATVSRHGAVKP